MKTITFQWLSCLGLTLGLFIAGCAPEPATPPVKPNLGSEAGSAEATDAPVSTDSGAAGEDEEKPPQDGAATNKKETKNDPAGNKNDPAGNTEKKTPASGERVVTKDWPMWGGDPTRNMVNKTTGISLDFNVGDAPDDSRKILWTAKLGSQTYGNPVVAGGKVLVGTNNGAEYRPQHQGDRGCVLCFDEQSGKFLWQLTREKLPQGRVNDWPEQGICSTPCIEGDKVWVVTNRAELMCLDLEGFYDGENDGPIQDEVDSDKEDADIIWSLDMIEELGVFPHNLATSSPVVYEDLVFVTTSNGVDEAHLELPAPRSPSFLAVNKKTGKVVWEDNTPFDQVLHGQWSSPAVGVVDGKAQVYMPGGDGWLYAMEPKTGKHIWKFDLNPKQSKWELGGRGTRNAIISTPVFFQNSVILAVGQDPEHGEGEGHIYRMDATKTGDISPQIDDAKGGWKDNPNSGQIWHWGGVDTDGDVTGEQGELIFRRTISTVAIHNGLVYAPDLSGFLHCLDFKTGQRYWQHDTFAAVWGSPMVADGKIFLGDEDGDLVVLKAGKKEDVLKEKTFNSSIYSTPTIAGGVMFISDRSKLYAIDTK